MDFSVSFGIVGYGIEGRSIHAWLQKHGGADIQIFDANLETPWENLAACTIVFRSPGIHPDKIKKYLPENWTGQITSATHYFLHHSPTKNIIGVTGTKGKGTTSTLITKILEQSGKKVFLGGNIGTPIFDFYDEITEDSIVVLELSSFQLYDIDLSPHISVLLRTDTEHLDWHENVEDYRNAKKNIFLFQSPEDVLVYFGGSPIVNTMIKDAKGTKISVLSDSARSITKNANGEIFYNNTLTSISISDIALRGEFHQENVFAAIAVAKQYNVSDEDIKTVLHFFTGLPMRLEKIATKNGRDYYNDSFSTIPETTISALSTFSTPVFLILGGSEKYSDFTQLASIISRNELVKKVYCIGITAPRIAKVLEESMYKNYVFSESFTSIFEDFQKESKEGDSLLLSPACASYGMFKNYKDRGNQFVALVTSI